ncbi:MULTISPECIES: hypothetical protein [unclassified Streptomyces]|uniref:hypothetical protein n=1 Tax=unclassified Streptomyces TaxID=2593676 RepID=UPI00081E7BB8|nr:MULTISPECIES: hypothetical protein [unclassified Streptomyces]MYZ34339.1 hypothetical protein [Streptomyces sp. SID4917]SCF66556.1 hypothetical protein GA0115259_100843 [Streptomyces sp. MnatMP-M17]
MATLVLDQLRQWQDEDRGGPEQWHAAWERTLQLLGPVWPDTTMSWDGVIHADGGAALTTALYIIAQDRGIAPADVHRIHVDELFTRAPGEHDLDLRRRWDARLRAHGHDLDDPTDPVTARWLQLRVDNSPPDNASDTVHIDNGTDHRWGPGFIEGLHCVLAPRYKDRLQF